MHDKNVEIRQVCDNTLDIIAVSIHKQPHYICALKSKSETSVCVCVCVCVCLLKADHVCL